MQDDNPYLAIIGVVGDVSEGSLRDGAKPTVFYSHRQMPETGMTLFARAKQPTALAGSAVNAIHAEPLRPSHRPRPGPQSSFSELIANTASAAYGGAGPEAGVRRATSSRGRSN